MTLLFGLKCFWKGKGLCKPGWLSHPVVAAVRDLIWGKFLFLSMLTGFSFFSPTIFSTPRELKMRSTPSYVKSASTKRRSTMGKRRNPPKGSVLFSKKQVPSFPRNASEATACVPTQPKQIVWTLVMQWKGNNCHEIPDSLRNFFFYYYRKYINPIFLNFQKYSFWSPFSCIESKHIFNTCTNF